MDKPSIFISHIKQEERLAKLIKDQISKDFLGLIDVFVSSDGDSISVGSKWLNNVSDALQNAKIEIIICSHESILKPWINFEAGAGWVKNIPVVPVCHTGLRPVDLPIPLNMLQGIEAKDKEGLQGLYLILAKQLNSATPNHSFDHLIASIVEFEQQYGVVRKIKSNVLPIIKIIPELREIFKPNPPNKNAAGNLNLLVVDKARPYLDSLQEAGFIQYSVGQMQSVMIGPEGQSTDVKIQVLDCYYQYSEQVFKDVG